ncbi:MAG: hypothetical protein ACTHK4_06400 [Mycobacteriales bacterium]
MSALTTSRIVRGAAVAVMASGAVAGAVSFSAAAPAATTHTLKFTTTEIADHIIGFHDLAANVEKHNGKIVGYDTTDCKMNVQTKTAHCEVDLARAQGTMRGWISLDLNTGSGTGVVTGGTRAFHGVSGSISAQSTTQSKTPVTAVTVRYHS